MSIWRRFGQTLLIVIAAPAFSFAASDTTNFKVTSYIPVLFKDTRWLIGGEFDADGSTEHNYDPPSQLNIRDAVYGDRSRDLSVQSDWSRRRVTRNSDSYMYLSGNFGYSGARTGSTRNDRLSQGQTDQVDSTSLDAYSFGLQPSFQYSRYLSHDFFAAFEGQGNVRISKEYNDNYIYSYSTIDSSVGSQVYIYRTTSSRDGNRSTEEYRYSLFLSAGWGRVYYGNYAATALYMVKELKDHGQLKSLPDYGVMQNLTEMIYQYRMKHVIDSRITRIEALSAITGYLRSQGIVDGTDPILELYLQDVWNYFPTDSRPFGFKVRFGGGVSDSRAWYADGGSGKVHSITIIRPTNAESPADTTINDGQESFAMSGRSRSTSPYLRAGVEYYRPIDLRTQLSITAAGYHYLDPKVTQQSYVTDWTQEYAATFSARLDYIFSSRTRVRATSDLYYETFESAGRYITYPNDAVSRSRLDYFSYSVSGTAEFRIAIPTILRANLSYYGSRRNERYQYDSSLPRSTRDGYALSLSISHYLY